MGETAAVAVLRLRALAGLAALLATSVGVLALAVPPLAPITRGDTAYPSLPGLLTVVCSLALLGAWAWFGLCIATCLVDSLTAPAPCRATVTERRGRGGRWLRPEAARRVAAIVVGSGLGGLVSASAAAGAPAAIVVPDAPVTPATPAALPAPAAPLPLPGRPLGGREALERRDTVVVRAGDSLWSVAATHLMPGRADPADVDVAWRRLHAANRAVIGPDPHLIQPGTRLELPERPSTEGTP